MDPNQVRNAFAAPATGQEFPAAGESEAVFAQVIARHHAQLYRVALRQLGNPEDAQDALQEGLLLAYRNRHQFQGRSELSTWLTRIVINAARGQRRRAASRLAASLEECTEAGREFADARPDPETHCAQLERSERLKRLLQRLSPPLRYAIQLCEIEELPLRQAAERLGIKPATLKCRLFRGRARLAALVA